MSVSFARNATASPVRLAVLLGAPALIALASAVYLTSMIDGMAAMSAMPSMAAMNLLTPAGLAALFVMWVVMMAAMMLPTAAPMIATYARMRGAGGATPGAGISVLCFAGGYVVAWAAYGLAATGLQAGLTASGLLSPMTMAITAGPLAGGVLIAAGLYQFLPLKQACLRHCRTPIGYLMTSWRDGNGGALAMGWRHGLFCVGCCAGLMALLFVAGVMNPFWIIALAAYSLIEKIAPRGPDIARVTGIAMAIAGTAMIAF